MSVDVQSRNISPGNDVQPGRAETSHIAILSGCTDSGPVNRAEFTADLNAKRVDNMMLPTLLRFRAAIAAENFNREI